jgi:hypothetical protein
VPVVVGLQLGVCGEDVDATNSSRAIFVDHGLLAGQEEPTVDAAVIADCSACASADR